jgi:hypothetical protein
MEERESCYSYILSRTQHGTLFLFEISFLFPKIEIRNVPFLSVIRYLAELLIRSNFSPLFGIRRFELTVGAEW